MFQSINAILALAVFVIFEKKYKKKSKKLSVITTIFVLVPLIFISSLYINSTAKAISIDHKSYIYTFIKDGITYHIKKFANNEDDEISFFSNFTMERFPLVHYLGKKDSQKFYVSNLMLMKPEDNKDRFFTYGYLLDDTLKSISNQQTKLLVFKNNLLRNDDHECYISILEKYLRIAKFRRIFINDFNYYNRIIAFNKNGMMAVNLSFFVRKNLIDNS